MATLIPLHINNNNYYSIHHSVQVISERAERAILVLTTNLSFSEWTQVRPNARLCKALLDRLTDSAHTSKRAPTVMGSHAPSTGKQNDAAHGAELVGEVAQYDDKYKLPYIRGSAGIIVALAEELF